MLAVVAVRQEFPGALVTAAVGLVLLAATVVRVKGRWLYELVPLAAGFLSRRRRQDLAWDSAGIGLIALLRPGATCQTIDTDLVITHESGMTAVLYPSGPVSTPTDLLPDTPSLAVQAIWHAQPGRPTQVWLGVHAPRTVDQLTDDQLRVNLSNGLRRIRKALKHKGMTARSGATGLTALAHLNGSTEIREDWDFWRTGPISQACFRVTTAPHPALITALLTSAPGVAVTVGWSAADRQDVVVRIAAGSGGAVDDAARVLGRVADLVRLDGEHRSGVAATLPIGAFPLRGP
ncbi:hypothetical protein GCM10010171_24150 [Actinokineospora fastidiosa]|uniref:Type VII secretion protein EccE n=1 Tax=Actinokineospora fastidiosa TaxID=1816 RepID=A0A918LCF4_9PSEU|nr:hypothetical protein GCM10010171_24150 [Actinokineospora fastidiosa]